MLGRQVRVLDAFARAAEWLSNNLETDLAIAPKVTEFHQLLERARRAAAHQELGRKLGASATRELNEAVRRLRHHHLRPIVTIARSAVDEGEALRGLAVAVTMPRRKMPALKLTAHANAVRDTVRPHLGWFLQNGRDPSFLDQLDDAVREVDRAIERRTRAMFIQVGATQALVIHLSRARRVLAILDSYVMVRYHRDAAKLEEWRSMCRVHRPARRHAGDAATQGFDSANPVRAVA